eukprot:7652313-Lingulodinium_polyedra.AAC.1
MTDEQRAAGQEHSTQQFLAEREVAGMRAPLEDHLPKPDFARGFPTTCMTASQHAANGPQLAAWLDPALMPGP